jgi:hypothetical protein
MKLPLAEPKLLKVVDRLIAILNTPSAYQAADEARSALTGWAKAWNKILSGPTTSSEEPPAPPSPKTYPVPPYTLPTET